MILLIQYTAASQRTPVMHPVFYKTLLLQLTTVMLGSVLSHADDAALEAIRDAGGIVRPIGAGWEIEFQRKGKEVGDHELAQLATLGESILSLNLRGTQTTDEGLRHLSNLKNLARLHLERTQVGDSGIAHLTGLTKLKYLNLYGTKITDAGLAPLESMRELKNLFVWQTAVTGSGCDGLSRALPELKIVRGVDLDKVVAEAAANKKEVKKIVRVDLKWVAAGTNNPPRSQGGGRISNIQIVNTRSEAVKLYWVEYGGGLEYYAEIAAGGSLTRATYSKATWFITDTDETPLGHFIAPLEPSQVEIPKS